jgi:hypothetical protein
VLILAAIAAILGYLLLYAGAKGIRWAAPWKLLTGS